VAKSRHQFDRIMQSHYVASKTLLIDGVTVPRFLYGTAWKEDATQNLVELAIQQGFRGIDTANQRRHSLSAGCNKRLCCWSMFLTLC
jgi:hypothetical protein